MPDDDEPVAYDAETRIFTMADGSLVSEDAYRRRVINSTANMGQLSRSFVPGPPNTTRLGLPHTRVKDPGHLRYIMEQVAGRGVLVYTSNHRFTYAAIFAGNRWYITGKGVFYGGNEFTEGEFVDVLMHPEVTSIWASTRFDEVYS